MTDVHLGEKALPLLSEAHRVVRSLDASDGPFVGLLVTRGDGVAVQLDAGRLAGWDGWRFAGSEHVAAPLDLVRRPDGHDVLLPWCPETVIAWAGRCTVDGAPLTAGQCVTVAASLLRGIGELGDAAAETQGNWWITSDGRPVFVIGDGDDPRVTGARLLAVVAEACRDKAMGRLLAAVSLGLEEELERPGVPSARIEQWERDLFELAAPRPLRGDAGVDGEAGAGRAAGVSAAAGVGAQADAGGKVSGAAPETFRRRETTTRRAGVPSRAGAAERSAARRSAARRPVAGSGNRRVRASRHDRASRRSGALSHIGRSLARAWFERFESVEQRTGRSVKSAVDRRASGGSDLRGPRRPRRSVLVLAVGAAGAVLVVGLLLPDGGNDQATAAPGRAVQVTDASATERSPSENDVVATGGDAATDGDAPMDQTAATEDSAATESPAAPSGETGSEARKADVDASVRDGDPAVAVVAILQEADGCRSQTGLNCDDLLADGVADPASLQQDLAAVCETRPSTQLVDEYGDIAVIRATGSAGNTVSGSGTRQSEWILVLARADEKWLVRDVYDVADQP